MDFVDLKDQMNRAVSLDSVPRRIISLVPSQTELLYDLGLEEEVIGITKFCIHPKVWFDSKTRIGGTKNVNIAKVAALKPDLIIGNKEENSESDILELEKIAPVWMSDILDFSSALEMISQAGALVNKAKQASDLVEALETKILEFQSGNSFSEKKSCFYFIWKDPYLTAGKQTYIDSALSLCGFENLQSQNRYPKWNFELNKTPDFIFLSSEPFPFKLEHVSWFQNKYPKSIVKIVDGEMFSWYGSRMMLAFEYFERLQSELKLK